MKNKNFLKILSICYSPTLPMFNKSQLPTGSCHHTSRSPTTITKKKFLTHTNFPTFEINKKYIVMASTSETGHAKNVANFDKLLSVCNGYGSAYNPSREALTLPSLQKQHDDANASLPVVKEAKTGFDTTTNTRRDLFKPIKKFATRLVNALDATDATDATVSDARTINNKIQGTRVSNKPAPPPDATTPAADGTSVSQQSYDLMIDHLDALIILVTAEPSYKPNEKDLTPTALNDLLKNLKTANKAVKDATTAYSNNRISRNKLLYAENTGLVPTAGEVKKYVLSIYGSSAPEYKQIIGLQFKYVKD